MRGWRGRNSYNTPTCPLKRGISKDNELLQMKLESYRIVVLEEK
jgi:hypothetical protein